MQIVIDIPEEVKHNVNAYGLSLCPRDKEQLINAIKNGTPLQKGHGRLFDERDIVNGNYEIIGNKIYEVEPIIDADKEQEK